MRANAISNLMVFIKAHLQIQKSITANLRLRLLQYLNRNNLLRFLVFLLELAETSREKLSTFQLALKHLIGQF